MPSRDSSTNAVTQSRYIATSIWLNWPANVSARVDSVRAAPASEKLIACVPPHLPAWKADHAVRIVAMAIAMVATSSTRSEALNIPLCSG